MESNTSQQKGFLTEKLKVVNVGIGMFADDLARQHVDVIRVDWQPPAGGDEELLKLLEKFGG